MTRYFGNWSNYKDMARDFNGWDYKGNQSNEKLPVSDRCILFAMYDTPDYEGYAIVVYRYRGQLYEVHGSHCSCYGLEDQWKPEPTTIEALKMRLGASWGIGATKEFKEFIHWLSEEY